MAVLEYGGSVLEFSPWLVDSPRLLQLSTVPEVTAETFPMARLEL